MLKSSVAFIVYAAISLASAPLASAPLARPAAPSILPAEYPALVHCTLVKRAKDIEAMFVAQDSEQARRKHGLYASKDELDAVQVTTTDVGSEIAARLFVQIVETCHKLEVGRPLGFWPEQLVSDWRARMGMPWGLQENDLANEVEFARCLKSFRPQLVEGYLSETSGSAQREIFRNFFRQAVCQTRFPLAIKESRLRRQLESRD